MTRIMLVLTLVTGIVGCTGLRGALSDADQVRVRDVQAVYDADFRAAVVADGVGVAPGRFARTLAVLPSDTSGLSQPVRGFYTLLEGLIYLQTGQLGQAKAIAPEVTGAASRLNTGGIADRNAIMAENFADLVAAREAEASLAKLSSNSAADNARRVAVVRDIQTRTRAVTGRLCKADAGEGDEGKAFVAAYQATALVQADRALQRACLPFATDAALCAGFLGERASLQDARNLMAAFGGPLADDSSQIARLRRDIERELIANQDGAPLGPAQSPCG